MKVKELINILKRGESGKHQTEKDRLRDKNWRKWI